MGLLLFMFVEDWDFEFEKYCVFLEYKFINFYMDFDEFKKIYFMEWIYCFWGCFIGFFFVILIIYFIVCCKVILWMVVNLVGIFVFIGF